MALATCPNCGHKVSTTALSCPNCGAPSPKLVYCTRCGRTMLDSATVCPACGTARYDGTLTSRFEKHKEPPVATEPTAAPPPDANATYTAAVQPEWRCPKCRSENIQRLAVIYSEGSISSTQTVVAIGLGDSSERAGLGGAVGQVSGTSSSTLAKIAAPPTPPAQPNSGIAGCLTAIVVFFLVLFVYMIICFLVFPTPSPDTPDTSDTGDFFSF